jgi:hypothetical protein
VSETFSSTPKAGSTVFTRGGVSKIAQHFRAAADAAFVEKGHSHAIFIEDDLLLSPDFLTLFWESACVSTGLDWAWPDLTWLLQSACVSTGLDWAWPDLTWLRDLSCSPSFGSRRISMDLDESRERERYGLPRRR